MAQFQGVVKWFNNERIWFLGRENGPDGFVHYSSIQAGGYRSWKEGEAGSFDVILGRKTPAGRPGDPPRGFVATGCRERVRYRRRWR